MRSTAQPPAALDTYEAMAAVYDGFTAHHDYEAWTRSLEALALTHGLSGRRLLDAACGTGKSFGPMVRRGYEVVGVDVSPAMLARAAEREPGAELVRADLREVTLDEEFDLVWCLCDAVNYLIEPGDLEVAVQRLARCLRPGGVLLFDSNNLLAYRTFFGETVCVERPGELLVWRGQAPRQFEPGQLARADLEILRADDDRRWTRATSRHAQRHFPRDAVLAALDAAGLELCGAYGQHPSGEIDPDAEETLHMKTVYVARRSNHDSERR